MTLSSISDDPQVRALADEAATILTDAVYVANTPALEAQSAHGLGVWFPTSYRSIGNANTGGFGVLAEYSMVFAFAEDAGWLGFLHAYWGK
jgi:hypothetical protein